MSAVLKEVSIMTQKGQITIPKSVRSALGVERGDRIAFRLDENRRVYVEKVVDEQSDPVIDRFLALLAANMASTPRQSIIALPASMRERIMDLVDNVEVDLDADIHGDVAL